nr:MULTISPECIES: hypothetical protein [unclassified Nostoc]MDZ7984488.1 hypothetical protein [Nostoc sp. DedVER02]MDZ8115565.1 hypothetical protein [Nostoc sp. DedVER01b]
MATYTRSDRIFSIRSRFIVLQLAWTDKLWFVLVGIKLSQYGICPQQSKPIKPLIIVRYELRSNTRYNTALKTT